jgi:hypothetical protein
MEEEVKQQKYEFCKVGLFELPGVVYDKDALTTDEHEAMVAWALENKCGKPMTDRLWSFKTEAQRDWFVLRWS